MSARLLSTFLTMTVLVACGGELESARPAPSPRQSPLEATFQAAPMKLYLSEDFHEAALAFKEKRKPRPFKGR